MAKLNEVSALKRPDINWIKIVVYSVLGLALCVLSIIIPQIFNLTLKYQVCIPIWFIFFFFYIHLKHIGIFLIKVYQAYAPDEIRNACIMIPTCSEYGIIALKKYGFLIGVIKTWKRLKRCSSDDEPGGIDLP